MITEANANCVDRKSFENFYKDYRNLENYTGNIVNDIKRTDDANYKENRVKKKLRTNLRMVLPNTLKNKISKK